MKCYVFVHSHLSSIQKGIQAAHVVAQLVWQNAPVTDIWFREHKTIVLLEGGNTQSLADLIVAVGRTDFESSIFAEDEQTLDNLTTAIAVIVDMNRHHDFLERNFLTKIDEASLAS